MKPNSLGNVKLLAKTPNHPLMLTPTPLTGPRRIGSWSPEEIEYCHYLSEEFKAGLLEGISDGTSLRQWLGLQLNCSPMRLSKKFDKSSGMLGLVKFEGRYDILGTMSSTERQKRVKGMTDLRIRLEKAVAREASGMKPLSHHLARHNRSLVTVSSPKKFRRKYASDDDMLFKTKAACHLLVMAPRKSNRICVRRANYMVDGSESDEDDGDGRIDTSMEPLPFRAPPNPAASSNSHLTSEEVEWLEAYANELPPMNSDDHEFWRSIREIESTGGIDPSAVFSTPVIEIKQEEHRGTPSTIAKDRGLLAIDMMRRGSF
ncbi:unnamed protein product [Aphanomyces euteiches]